MDLYFLGTCAGMPSKERNVTSMALRLFEERGTFWLFDCGEGTQHQILRSPIRVSKLEKIFITHLHGDHIFGLPGLLSSRSYQGGQSDLDLYGPVGIREFIETAIKLSGTHLDYQLHIHEFDQNGVLFKDEQFTVTIAKLDHRIDSYGYRIEEAPVPGKLLQDKLKQLGVPPGPIYSQIKAGQDVTLADGTQLIAKDYQGPQIPGRTVVILGDTRVCDAIVPLANGADLLVHEATFAAELEELAYRYHHCTSKQAAEHAQAAGVEELILTHFSSRYQEEVIGKLLEEAQTFHPNTHLAQDHQTFFIPRKKTADPAN